MLDKAFPEGFDLRSEIFKRMGFADGKFELADGQTLEDMMKGFIGTDGADMKSLMSDLGIDDLSGTFSGLSTDISGLTDALSGDGETSLTSLLGNLGTTLGGEGGVNEALSEFQAMIGSVGDEANGIDASGVLASITEMRDLMNVDETGTGTLSCKLVLDCEEYDQAIAQLRDGLTTDGYLASPQVNNLIQASIDLSPLETAIDGLKTDNQTNFSEVQRLVSGLSSDIITLANRMSEIQMILDTGVLVGELSARVDQELGYAYST
jgi:hypothetical protein